MKRPIDPNLDSADANFLFAEKTGDADLKSNDSNMAFSREEQESGDLFTQ